ncbi:MAG: Mce-associated rane protein [Mycobacteriales bacterium]
MNTSDHPSDDREPAGGTVGEPAGEATAQEPDADDTATDSDEPDGSAGRRRSARPAVRAVMVVVVIALAGLTALQAVGYHRARARAAAEAAVLGPAKTAAARILSYDYRHIDRDASQASAVLTGVFRGQYEAVMRQQIVPQAPKQHAVVQAEVLSAGVTAVSADGTQAVVLIFANQTVSNTSTPQPRVDQVRVRLTLDRVGQGWLVSKVDAL